MRNPLRALFEARTIGTSHELLQSLWRAGYGTASGQRVSEATALNVAAIWTGIAIRARLLSTLPIDIVEKVDERTRRPVGTHQISRLLHQPNQYSLRQTKSELLGMTEAHRVLRGNGFWWKNLVSVTRDGNTFLDPVELLPIHPDKLEVIDAPTEFGPSTYTLHRANGATPIELPANEVVHFKSLSTDGRRGRSLIADLKELIGGALATQEHANSLWSNDATPSVVLSHPKVLGDKARKGLEESWEHTYGRGKDKRRVAVIEEGMELKQLSLTPEDGQFLQTSQDLRDQIAAALFIPSFMMGLSSKQTSWGSGIEQQHLGLLTFTMRPDLVTWEERLQMDLIANPARFQIKFNVGGFARGDMASQAQFFWMMRQMGAMSANDVRAMFDWNPIANGDVYLQPSNLAPLGSNPLDPKTPAKDTE